MGEPQDQTGTREREPTLRYTFVRYVLPPAVPWLALIAALLILVSNFDDPKHIEGVLHVFAPTAGLTSLGIGISLGINARRAP